MQTLSQIKMLLARQGVRPKHRLGQNFLHDQNQIRRLVESGEIARGDLVLEIGPGTGTMTEAILERGAEVVACEIDGDMVAILRSHVVPSFGEGRVRIVEGDCLQSKRSLNDVLFQELDRPFKLVSNLPYQITSPLIATLLLQHWEHRTRYYCEGIFVTVQREAADRLLAVRRTKDYGPLAILVSLLTESERIGNLPPSCFWPEPKVRSSMIALRPKIFDIVDQSIDIIGFSEFLERCFQTRRKQLGSILRGFGDWPEGVVGTMRPEEVEASAWVEMYRRFCEYDLSK